MTNIYFSYASREKPVFGTVYLMHGYGGSPIEPCMKMPMYAALEHGFDVVAIEGVALSATSGTKKKLAEMNLARQKLALLQGLISCKTNYRLSADYKIAWAHSMSCRALSDLVVQYKHLRKYFDEVVLNNPYFLPPSKLQAMKKRFMEKDPSGKLWMKLATKPTLQPCPIENYKVPADIYNFQVPFPITWPSDLESLAKKMSKIIHHFRVNFVLGT
ncbi:MAG: hypothetical protein LBF37_02430, partial [Rickettsiales bacterium]|nr:hypothetical protein [Rickettsiales bacterium]